MKRTTELMNARFEAQRGGEKERETEKNARTGLEWEGGDCEVSSCRIKEEGKGKNVMTRTKCVRGENKCGVRTNFTK